jgi:hypothetical protein
MFQQNTGDSDGDILIAYVAVRFGNESILFLVENLEVAPRLMPPL